MSRIWTLADLHLCFSCPEKDMAVFGRAWQDYAQRIEKHWREHVQEEDWVLIPGDITWAMKFEQALKDLEWIETLPGKKVLSRGNHDYWWPTAGKWNKAGFKTLFNAQQQLVELNSCTAVVGVKFTDSHEYSFESIIDWDPTRPRANGSIDLQAFEKEVERLKQALRLFQPYHKKRIVMIHYPPIGLLGESTRASALFEEFAVETVVFGHLHSLKAQSASFGTFRNVRYLFCAADYVDFTPIEVSNLEDEAVL